MLYVIIIFFSISLFTFPLLFITDSMRVYMVSISGLTICIRYIYNKIDTGEYEPKKKKTKNFQLENERMYNICAPTLFRLITEMEIRVERERHFHFCDSFQMKCE